MNTLEVSPLQPTVFGAMRRHAVVFGACVVAAAVIALAFGLWATMEASATASIVVSDPTASGGGRPDANYPANQASIIRLPSTSERAARLVNGQIPEAKLSTEEFSSRLKVNLDSDSSLIKVTFRDSDPKIAAAGANAAVTAYRGILDEYAQQKNNDTLKRIDDAILALDSRIRAAVDQDATSPDNQAKAQLQSRRTQLVLDPPTVASGIVAASRATVPDVPWTTAAVRYGLLGAVIGILPAAGVSYLVATRRRRFGDRSEAELVLERPLLAEIADFRIERLPTDLPAFDRPISSAAEGFRFAVNGLDAESGTGYAFISAVHGAGTSVVTANVAVTAAAAGKRVLVIDGDLEEGNLSWLFGMTADKPGLAQLLRGDIDIDDAIHRVTSVSGQLWLMPGGGSGGAQGELLGGAKAANVFATIKQRFDLVVVDCPAMLHIASGSRLAQLMDSTVVVVPHGSDVGQLEELDRRARLMRLHVTGYLYNRSPRGRRGGSRSANRPEPLSEPRRLELPAQSGVTQ